MYGYCIVTVIFSVVKNHADPDQTCHFDADPAPGWIPDGIKIMRSFPKYYTF